MPGKSLTQGLPVHPHACGEYDPLMMAAAKACGSSPRVWGIQVLLYDGYVCRRFIPTRVGNTCVEAQIQEANAVHPHACGEYIQTMHHH